MSNPPLIFPKKIVYECPNCSEDIEVEVTNGVAAPLTKCDCGFLLQTQQPGSQEDQLADQIDTFTKWLNRVWKRNGTLGRAMILSIFLGMASPFILGAVAVLLVYFWIIPYAVTVTDKLAVFGVLFTLLTALAFKIGNFSSQILQGAYVTRKKRNPLI